MDESCVERHVKQTESAMVQRANVPILMADDALTSSGQHGTACILTPHLHVSRASLRRVKPNFIIAWSLLLSAAIPAARCMHARAAVPAVASHAVRILQSAAANHSSCRQ